MPEHLKKSKVPLPPHPYHRREPLPEQRPKSIEEDPDAQERIKTILESPSYRQADEDLDFLNRYDVRGVRLQVDYLKAELLLNSTPSDTRSLSSEEREFESPRPFSDKSKRYAQPKRPTLRIRMWHIGLKLRSASLLRVIIMTWLASSDASSETAGRAPKGTIW